MPDPFHSSGTAPDLHCKHTAHISPHMVSQILEYIRRNSTALVCVFLSTRGGFIALSPISPQDIFLQPFSCSREEKEEDVDYHSPYHPYHHPHGHHLHLHNLVKNI